MNTYTYRLYNCKAHIVTRGKKGFEHTEIFSYGTLVFRYEYNNGEIRAALDRYPTITTMQHLRKAVTWLTNNRHFGASEVLDWLYRSTIREKKRFVIYYSTGDGTNDMQFPNENPLK